MSSRSWLSLMVSLGLAGCTAAETAERRPEVAPEQVPAARVHSTSIENDGWTLRL